MMRSILGFYGLFGVAFYTLGGRVSNTAFIAEVLGGCFVILCLVSLVAGALRELNQAGGASARARGPEQNGTIARGERSACASTGSVREARGARPATPRPEVNLRLKAAIARLERRRPYRLPRPTQRDARRSAGASTRSSH